MKNCATSRLQYLSKIVSFPPDAVAHLKGCPICPQINGCVFFYKTSLGSLVVADICCLPVKNRCGFFAFHIHEGRMCAGNTVDPFLTAEGHYNPTGEAHPNHAGDMPPLLSNKDGYAFLSFVSGRFTVDEIIGRTVIIHIDPDNFTSQPSGNSGEKIACGVIKSC